MRGLLFALALMLAFALPLSAADGMPDLSRELSDFADAIPDDVRDDLPPALLAGEPSAVQIAPGEILRHILDTLRSAFTGAGKTLARLTGCILLAAVTRTLCPDAGVCIRMCICCAILGGIGDLFALVHTCLDGLQTIVSALIPLLCAIFAAGGNVGTASAAGTSLSLFLAVGELLCGQIFLPLTAASGGLTIAGIFPGGERMQSVNSAIRRTLGWLLGLFGALFAAVMAAQTVLAAGADSVSARTLKFAVGSAVPVIGGAVGDTMRTIGSALAYLRDSAGLAGMWVLALVALPPLCALFVHRALLLAAGSAAELLGCGDEARLCRELAGVVGLLLAILGLALICLIFALVLLLRVTLAHG